MLILIAGVPYTGKTVSACTFPGKKLYLDWDDKFESVMHTKGKDGKLLVPDWKDIVVVKFIKSQVSDLDFGYNKQKNSPVPKYTQGSEELITRYNKIVTELGKDGCITWGGEKLGPFDTVIVDSLTGMFNVWEDMIFRNSGLSALGQQEYGQLKNLLFKQFIPAMKTIHIPHSLNPNMIS